MQMRPMGRSTRNNRNTKNTRGGGGSSGGRGSTRGGSRTMGERSGGGPRREGRRPPRIMKQVMSKGEIIDYKNLPLLQRCLTDRGKLFSHRVTGITTSDQRKLTTAIKRARFLGLLPSGSQR